MSQGIILGRAGQQLATCAVCRKPSPAENVSRRGLCFDCWNEATAEQGWSAEPMIAVTFADGRGMAYPVRLMLPALLRGVEGERGNDTNPARALARVLREREELRRLQTEEDTWGEVVCYYCGADHDDHANDESLVTVEEADGLPPIYYCKSFRACDSRLAQQIAALVQKMAANQNGN